MSAPHSKDQPDDLSCHSRHSSAQSTASIQSLHISSVPLFSSQASPSSDATSYHVYHRNHADGSVDQGSALATDQVVGLMRTFNLSNSPTAECELEEGEIRQNPKSPVGKAPRQREQSFGGPLIGSAHASGVNSLSTMPTSSTLSSIPSSSSFHTASSSSSIPTSISNSGSVNDISSLCHSGSYQNVPPSSVSQDPADEGQLATAATSTPQAFRGKVPETGPIDLEALEKDTTNETPAITLDPNAPAHIPSSDDGTASVDTSDDQIKSPNVYINGLPPHFPEDQLLELARPFGEVRSVRSFTRHVGEKESGYGFILFMTVEAAEKCIQSLRRFKNLHPTFSKQSHKIPGMPYTQSSSQSGWTHENDNGPSLAQGAGARSIAGKNQTGELSFKFKMERLQDPNSTNLYLEGLPLSIDEPSLAALVSPHRIKSSRFFQTRLSNPPRIIAFVRLETRHGAEEVIERLHGRMVRGWNDPGSRISVRFADTSEQRELRRNERTVREDDTVSPGRITIAQAALLNLRGRDQLHNPPQSGLNAPLIGAGRLAHGTAPTANQVYNDFSSNAHDISSAAAGGYRGSASDLTSAAQLLAGMNNGSHRRASAFHQNAPLSNVGDQTHQDLTPAMAALLDSLRGSGTPWTGHDDHYTAPQGQLPILRNAHSVLGDVDLNLAYLPQQYQNRVGGGVSQNRSGFTPAEELILNAHVQRRKGGNVGGMSRQQDPHEGEFADLSVGVRGYRAQASTMALSHQQAASYYSSSGNLPVVVESDDFEAEPSHQLTRYPHSQLNGRTRAGVQARNSSLRERDGGHHHSQYDPQNVNVLPNRNYNNLLNNNRNPQAHIRSTTLPPTSTPSSVVPRHYQHNSMSVPKSRNITNDIMRTTYSQSQTIPSQHSHLNHKSTNSISGITNDSKNLHSSNHNNSQYTDASDIRISDEGAYTDPTSANHPQHHYRHNYSSKTDGDQDPSFRNLQLKKDFDDGRFGAPHSFPRDSGVYDVPQTSPPLVSPALTYSSRGSGATLSPSTPYVGSYSTSSGQETNGLETERDER